MSDVAQLPKPAVPEAGLGVRAADVVPDAGEPVGDNHVEADEQDEHHGSILDVAVDLSDDSAQAQQADHLERAEQRADSLLLFMSKFKFKFKFVFGVIRVG